MLASFRERTCKLKKKKKKGKAKRNIPSLITGLPSPQQKQAYNRSSNHHKQCPSLQREPENEGLCRSDFEKSAAHLYAFRSSSTQRGGLRGRDGVRSL